MEQRVIVRFLILKKLCATELKEVHGHAVLSHSGAKKWRNRFANGRVTLEDGPRSERALWDLYEPLSTEIHLFHAGADTRSSE
jgi:hypothetical protein